MLKQLEGSQGIAEAIALCRPGVVCAYPITPQTHIVESLGEMIHSGAIKNARFINVESEMSAISVAMGGCVSGVRSYTATSSQGLLFMMEAVYNASGLGLPLVMTLGNRTIGSPINIWNDHSDVMSVRDAGWLLLFADNNQDALDLHIQAFRIAEEAGIPVMVCVDGFILTHAYEPVDVPTQEQVDQFLPAYKSIQTLDFDDVCAIGAMVPPNVFTEVRYIAHNKYHQAKKIILDVQKEFKNIFGRDSGGMIRTYKTDDAPTVVVSMGSVAGTIYDAIDELREEGHNIGHVSICSYRPFPVEELRHVLCNKERVIVVEKAFSMGRGGVLYEEMQLALRSDDVQIHSVIAGLGGREIFKEDLKKIFTKKDLEKELFLNLRHELLKDIIN